MKKLIPILICLTFLSTACDSIQKVIRTNIPGITDYKYFDLDLIQKADEPFNFHTQQNLTSLPDAHHWVVSRRNNTDQSFEDFLKNTNTVSFLIIRNDTILYENYFNGYTESSPSLVFSITKSVVSALVGIAIEEGYIESVDQSVSDFIPAFQNDDRKYITVNHLLNMTDGLNFSDYKTTHRLLGMYFNANQREYLERIRLKHPPGKVFDYKSISTLILGVVLENAIEKPLASYIEEKIWKPLGMEYTAAMMLDNKDGTSLAYGGLVARARDLAKIGRLYLNNGVWEGEEIIPHQWVQSTPVRDTILGRYYNYHKAWWLDTYLDRNIFDKRDFYAGGHGGQVLYINPEQNLIIVRQGKSRSGVRWGHSVSRLARLLYDENMQEEEPKYLNQDLIAGKYYNPVNGTLFELLIQNNRMVITDGQVSLELDRESNICFTNRRENVRIIMNLEEGNVNGVFLDKGGRYLTYFNRELSGAVLKD